MTVNKIAIVAQGLSGGGAERVSSILANYFAEKGYGVLFICAYDSKRGYFISDSIDVVSISSKSKTRIGRLIDRNRRIYMTLKNYRPSVVFAFICNEMILSQIKGINVIHSLRNDPRKIDNSFIARKLRLFAYRKALRIVFQTTDALLYFNKKIQKRGVVIANPIDVSTMPHWEDEKHEKRFVSAARLAPQKNIPLLIESFVDVHKVHPEYRLEIYGDGELRRELDELIKEQNADGFIKLMKYSDSIHQIIAQSSAFVLSSDYEGLSNSMLEALIIGIPCICTDWPSGGSRQFIKSGYNGLLVPIRDKEALSKAMLSVIENKNISLSFSVNSRIYRNTLDKRVICSKWEELILINNED